MLGLPNFVSHIEPSHVGTDEGSAEPHINAVHIEKLHMPLERDSAALIVTEMFVFSCFLHFVPGHSMMFLLLYHVLQGVWTSISAQ
jgi:hypothetical protein